MRESLRKVLQSELGTYLQWLARLIVVGAGVFVALSMTWCGGAGCGGIAVGPPTTSSWSSGLVDGPASPVVAILAGVRTIGFSGGQQYRHLQCSGVPSGVTVSYTYYPPGGAWNFFYSRAPDLVTERYYQWTNLPPATDIFVVFQFPLIDIYNPWHRVPFNATESFTVRTSDGGVSAVMHTTEVWRGGAQAETAPTADFAQTTPAADAASSGKVWQIVRWLDFPGETMTTAKCTQWINLLRSDQAFVALRVPVAASEVVSHAVSVPLLLSGDFVPQMQIWRYTPYPSKTVYSTTLQLRPDRLETLANILPQAEGERWLALGVPPDAPACADGINQAAKTWSFGARIFLDLSRQTNSCVGCTLPFYFCYAGQDEPLTAQTMPLALALAGGDANVATYQGYGITCMGPQSMQLITNLIWKLGGAATDIVTPTQSLRFLHTLKNSTGSSQSYNLTAESGLRVAWRFYGGTADAPNLQLPITLPMAVANNELKYFWVISDPLPANTPHGPYNLRLTAAPVSAPADVQWTADTIWVGDWVAPPEGPPVRRYVYMPIVFKNWRR